MPITIGADVDSGFDRPIGLLKDCHRRIERFLGVLEKVAALSAGSPLTPDQSKSLQNAITYFEEAEPRHVADEEASLFPRMRRHPEAQPALTQLEVLEKDHCRAQALHATIHAIGHFWIDLGVIPENQHRKFSEAVGRLASLYREHMRLEEEQVFPLADKLLTAEESDEIGQEMADRRGLFATA